MILSYCGSEKMPIGKVILGTSAPIYVSGPLLGPVLLHFSLIGDTNSYGFSKGARFLLLELPVWSRVEVKQLFKGNTSEGVGTQMGIPSHWH